MLTLVDESEQKFTKTVVKKERNKKKDKERKDKEIDAMINASKIVRVNSLTEDVHR